jgi:hypothetical protein
MVNPAGTKERQRSPWLGYTASPAGRTPRYDDIDHALFSLMNGNSASVAPATAAPAFDTLCLGERAGVRD